MARVRNKATGRAWDVPVGHYSLTSAEYEVLPERAPEPVKVPAEAPAPKAPPKPRARKTK